MSPEAGSGDTIAVGEVAGSASTGMAASRRIPVTMIPAAIATTSSLNRTHASMTERNSRHPLIQRCA